MQAVILAAGKGSRLHPITISISKAMLPILGKPILERIMESIAACGIRNFTLVISPEDNQIKEYFQSESTLDIDIRFVYQAERLGMADALKQAAPLLKEDFVLSACDNLVSVEDVWHLMNRWNHYPNLSALLTLIEVPVAEIVKTGMVTLEGDRVRSIIEKPSPSQVSSNIASMPLYCFSLGLLDFLPQVPLSPRGEYELQDAIQMLIEEDGDVRGLFFQRRFSLTTATDLLEINQHYLENGLESWRNAPQAVGQGTQLLQPLFIERGTVIGSSCRIGPNVYIGKNVQIGDNIQLENVVVLQDAVISDNLTLRDQVVTV